MTDRPLLLDLYCGAGGAGMGYHRAGFEVVGVDIKPQPRYPFELYRAHALDMLPLVADQFDAIHASPPCQHYSALNAIWKRDYPDLIPATREALQETGKPWVLENVMSAPIRRDLMLCGEMFELAVIRHRKFEAGNWTPIQPQHIKHRGRVKGYNHGKKYDGYYFPVYGIGGCKGTVAEWQAAMGIDWTDVRKEIAEAIPPAYTEFIGGQLIGQL